MGVRGALMETEWSGRLLSKIGGQRGGQPWEMSGESVPGVIASHVSAFCVSPLLHRGTCPELGGLHRGSAEGPRGRDGPQQPPRAQIPGTQAEAKATFGYGPGPVHGMVTESCEIIPVKD